MTFVLWQRGRDTGIASTRLVLRAAEVPLLSDAQTLRDRLQALHSEQAQRVDAACEEARVRGHNLGLEQGVLAASDEVASSLTTLALAAEHERERLRTQVGALALHVARKLLGQLADDERLVSLADTAARDMLPATALTLVVHPEQADGVRARLAGRSSESARGAPPPLAFEVRADPACEFDSCRIETELGSVDASLDAQLARLGDAWGVKPLA
jgi:flagellar biosynthesis/type III secretory pathway protein FliH